MLATVSWTCDTSVSALVGQLEVDLRVTARSLKVRLDGRIKQAGTASRTPTCVKDSGMVEKCCRFVPTPVLRARERSSVHW